MKKRALWTQAELWTIFLDVEIDGDKLTEYKVEELQEICRTLGLNVTGNKKILSIRIIEELYNQFYTKYLSMRNTSFMRNQAWDYVEATGLDESFTRMIIRQIERGKKKTTIDENGNTITEYTLYDSFQACHDIINSGFTDEIYNDIFQSIRLYIWESLMNDNAYILNGRIKFSDPDFTNNYSLFKHCIKCATSTLSTYRATYNKGKKDVPFDSVIGYDENGKEYDLSVEYTERYMQILSSMIIPDNLEHGDMLDDFIDYVSLKYPKKADSVRMVIYYRMSGYSDYEIAYFMRKSKHTISNLSTFIKSVGHEYVLNGGKAFTFEREEREKEIDLYDTRKAYKSVIEKVILPTESMYMTEVEKPLVFHDSVYWYDTERNGKKIKVRATIKQTDEKKERYKVYREYFNFAIDKELYYKNTDKQKEYREYAHKFALIQMKKQFPRNTHGIVYA